MQLLKTLLLFAHCAVYAVTAEEVCLWESFNVSCDAGEVVFIEKALFGSTHDNRCFNLTENDTSCSADIRFEIQNQIGLNQSIQLKLASDFFTTKTPTCLNGRMPFLEIVYQCAKTVRNEVCFEEIFNATCPSGAFIVIQSALYGRMRISRCTDFNATELNCYANVQPYLHSLCNERNECDIKAADHTFKHAIGSCQTNLKPYLEVFFTCRPIHERNSSLLGDIEFSCPQFFLHTDATMQRIDDEYHVMCDNMTLTHTLFCTDGKWNIDPEQLCLNRTKYAGDPMSTMQMVIIVVPCATAALIIFLATIAVEVLICKHGFRNQRRSTNSCYVEFNEVHPNASTDFSNSWQNSSLRNDVPTASPLYESLASSNNQQCRLQPDFHIYAELIHDNELKTHA